MTDLSKQLLEKAHGGLKINPDEQRRYLGTFEERVLGYVDIDTANSPQLEKAFIYFRKPSGKSRATICEDFTNYRI